jgi:hypothetical protein
MIAMVLDHEVQPVTLYSLLKVNQRCAETCCLHLQGQRISQARNQCEVGSN